MSSTRARRKPRRRAARKSRRVGLFKGAGERTLTISLSVVTALIISLLTSVMAFFVKGCLEGPRGTLVVKRVFLNQARADFYRNYAHRPAPAGSKGQFGVIVVVKRQADNAQSCRLEWSLINANGQAPVTDDSLVNQPAQDVAQGAHACNSTTELWVAFPSSEAIASNIAIEVGLYAGGTKLDSDQTQEIQLG